MLKSKLTGIACVLVLTAMIFTGCPDGGGGTTTTPVSVTGVTLTADVSSSGSSTIYLGSTDANLPASVIFTAVVEPANATNKAVTWTVTPDTFVTWNEATRTATAKAVGGPTTISVKTADGNFTAEVTVTVTVAPAPGDIPVASVSVTPATALSFNKASGAAVFTPATETLTAAVTPDNATNKTVTWTSSDTAVATVSATGVVTPIAAGEAKIYATSVGVNASGAVVKSNDVDVTVTVAPGPGDIPVASVSVTPATALSFNKASGAAVFTPATETLTAAVTPDNATNKTVTWTSSDSAVATVSATGVVTPIAAGEAKIYATSVGVNASGQTVKSNEVDVTVTVASVVPTEPNLIFEWTHATNGQAAITGTSGTAWSSGANNTSNYRGTLNGNPEGVKASTKFSITTNSNNNASISYDNGFHFNGKLGTSNLLLSIGTDTTRSTTSSGTSHVAGDFDFYNLPAGKDGIKITLAVDFKESAAGARNITMSLNNNTATAANTPLNTYGNSQLFLLSPANKNDTFTESGNDATHIGSYDGATFVSKVFKPADFTEYTDDTLGRGTLKTAFFCIIVQVNSEIAGADIVINGIKVEYVDHVPIGTANIIINTEANFAGFPNTIVLSKNEVGGNPSTQTLSLTQYASANWYVDGALVGTTGSYTLDAAVLDIGKHSLTMVVEYKGQYYSKKADFSVVR